MTTCLPGAQFPLRGSFWRNGKKHGIQGVLFSSETFCHSWAPYINARVGDGKTGQGTMAESFPLCLCGHTDVPYEELHYVWMRDWPQSFAHARQALCQWLTAQAPRDAHWQPLDVYKGGDIVLQSRRASLIGAAMFALPLHSGPDRGNFPSMIIATARTGQRRSRLPLKRHLKHRQT